MLGSAMAMVILKEKVRLRGWLGLMICILGIIYIGYTPASDTNVNVIGGIMLAAIAAIGWATEGGVCGYGMKAGNVDPQMALLIRELTSGVVYILIVAPLMVGGYDNLITGTTAVFSDTVCWMTLLFTALIGMLSFFCWYNVTYSFWAVVFTFIFVGSTLSVNIIVGSILVVTGVAVATLVSRKKKQ